MMKGTAERLFAPYAGKLALILKGSTLSPYHPELDVWVSHVEDALALGADAIAMALTVGSAEQASLLENVADLVAESAPMGMPVIVHAYPNGSLVPAAERYTAPRVAYASRLVAELGVDVVKTFYTGSAESFAQVVAAAKPAIVVAAGGACLDTPLDCFRMAQNVVAAGAACITFGRNVWQSRRPRLMVELLARIVHQGMTPEDADAAWRE
jgi:fructose-bisphosphate aldolase, class I